VQVALGPEAVLHLQRVAGNEAVGQALGRSVLAVQRASLTDSGIQKDFEGGLRAVFQNWAKLKRTERTTALQGLINGQLEVVGAPGIMVVPLKVGGALTNIGPTTLGRFEAQFWSMNVRQNDLDNALSKEGEAELADTLFHETRHVEQFVRAVRWLAGKRVAPAEIAAQLGMAVERVQEVLSMKGSSGASRKGGDQQAETWATSIPGSRQVEDKRAVADARFSKASAAVNALHVEFLPLRRKGTEAVPKPTVRYQERLELVEQEFGAAVEDRKQAYRAYEQQAHEADAFAVGEAMRARFAGKAERMPGDEKVALDASIDFILLAELRKAMHTPPPRPARPDSHGLHALPPTPTPPRRPLPPTPERKKK
jgi:hypothetical protein